MPLPESLSIVIVYHEGISYLKACLHSVLSTVRESDEIILVVNNENMAVHQTDIFKNRVRYINYYENLGYAKAANEGVKACQHEYVIISDHDLVYQPGWLEALWKFYSSDSELGAVCCQIINPLSNNVLDYGIAFSEFNFAHPFMDLPLDHELVNVDRTAQMICAGGILVNKDTFQTVGGFDENFGSLYTDLDLCLRLKQKRLKVGVAAGAQAYHFAGEFAQAGKAYKASFLKADVKGAFMRKNAAILEIDLEKYFKISADYFFRKNGMFKQYFVCNMMNVVNPRLYEEVLLSLNATIYDRITRPSGSRDAENIRLFDTLGFDMMALGVPIAYLVDRYVSVIDNAFWWRERRSFLNDIVIDRNGNILSINEILNQQATRKDN